MRELKPCPFCGGEARQHAAFARGASDMVGVYVECDGCEACSKTAWGEGAQERSAAAWNRRAERTARVEEDTKRASQTQLVVTKSCSECGHCFGAETHYERMFEGMVLNEIELPSYCPNCGAKVTDE